MGWFGGVCVVSDEFSVASCCLCKYYNVYFMILYYTLSILIEILDIIHSLDIYSIILAVESTIRQFRCTPFLRSLWRA